VAGFPRSWIVPKAERDARRAEHELTRLIERSQFRDSLQELLDELENNRRDLEIQLGTSLIYGVQFPGSAWAKNQHVLGADQHSAARELVHDAYLRTHAINQKALERFDAAAASHVDVNNPEWKKLTDDEIQERQAALEAVEKARAAVQAIKDSRS
jgi:hypothetical protein